MNEQLERAVTALLKRYPSFIIGRESLIVFLSKFVPHVRIKQDIVDLEAGGHITRIRGTEDYWITWELRK